MRACVCVCVYVYIYIYIYICMRSVRVRACLLRVAGFHFRRLVEMEEEIRELTGEGGTRSYAASHSSPKTKCKTAPSCSDFPAYPASGAAETSEPAQARAQEPAADTGDVDFKSVML